MSFASLKASVRDAVDILRFAKNPVNVVRAMLPPHMQRRRILNVGTPAGDIPPKLLPARLKALTNQLKAEALSEDGTRVHYGGLASSPTFSEMQTLSVELQGLRPEHLGGFSEQLAFWLNLYNVLTLHGIIALGLKSSVMENPAFFGTVAYQIGGETFTPDDIENGVLRRNAPHPATGFSMFTESDPRMAYTVERLEPRLHFALVCAAHSCPPLAFYEAHNLEAQLDLAAASFVNADVQIKGEGGPIEISTLFRAYEVDFGGRDGLLRFIAQHLDDEPKIRFKAALAAGAQLQFRRYDWALNGM